MKLSDIVKNYRLEHNLSVSEMAKRSGLSKGYISMIERGINPRTNTPISPTLNTLNKLSRGMNVDLEELLNCMDPEESVNLVDRLFVMGNIKTIPDIADKPDLYANFKRSDLVEEPDTNGTTGYYTDPETARLAQKMFEDPEMRALYHMKQNMAPEKFKAHYDMMKKLYDMEHPEDADGFTGA